MTEDQEELLEEARESIAASSLLLAGGFPGYAASRAYYAMFYIAEAFLEELGMSFSKHSAVIAAFGQHFAQTGRVPVEFHRFLLEAFDLRHNGGSACLSFKQTRGQRCNVPSSYCYSCYKEKEMRGAGGLSSSSCF